MRSFINFLVVLVIYFAGTAANTGDKSPKGPSKAPEVIRLKDGRSVYKKAEDIQPLKTGALPDVSVKDSEGKTVKLKELASKKPMLLIVYRGGWCPFCNRQLAGLQNVADKIQEKGYQIVALSADRPEKIREALKERKFEYTLLSDSSMEASIALGLAFQVPEKLVQTYKEKYQIDLEDASGEKHHYLPVPAVYVVDSKGQIQFAYANPNYKVRLSNDELLEALAK